MSANEAEMIIRDPDEGWLVTAGKKTRCKDWMGGGLGRLTQIASGQHTSFLARSALSLVSCCWAMAMSIAIISACFDACFQRIFLTRSFSLEESFSQS